MKIKLEIELSNENGPDQDKSAVAQQLIEDLDGTSYWVTSEEHPDETEYMIASVEHVE